VWCYISLGFVTFVWLGVEKSYYFYACRVTLTFYSLSGLDLLGSLDVVRSERQLVIAWIYSLQQKTTTLGKYLPIFSFIQTIPSENHVL